MSQHDQNIANDNGANVRSDINAALAAIFGNSSGASAPATTIAYQLWADTTTGLLKIRNAANSGWVTLGLMASTGLGFAQQSSDIASATTTNLDSATGNLVDVTGTTTITAITLAQGAYRLVRFTGALTLTHGSSLVLPGAANITTAAGDYAIFVGYAAGVVRCLSYTQAGAWTTYTPTVTAGTGTFTTLGTVTGRYAVLGKTVFVEIKIPITTNGSAAGSINATLPFTAAAFNYLLPGREDNSTGKLLQGTIQASDTKTVIYNYDNSYPGGSGYSIYVSGVYERA